MPVHTDREELINLRVSVARIAQVLDLDKAAAFDPGSPYEVLRAAAEHEERGWNALACTIVDEIELLNSEINSLRAELYERNNPL